MHYARRKTCGKTTTNVRVDRSDSLPFEVTTSAHLAREHEATSFVEASRARIGRHAVQESRAGRAMQTARHDGLRVQPLDRGAHEGRGQPGAAALLSESGGGG